MFKNKYLFCINIGEGMPKQIVVIICIILLPFSIWSQNLSVYYQAAEGLSGDTLHYVLHNIIKNHTEFPYTSSNTDTWDILKESDSDPVNSAKLLWFIQAG